MRNLINTALFVIVVLGLYSCYRETQVLVNPQFKANVENNNYTSPVNIGIENNTTGADFYEWTFEGGTPSSSKEKNPGTITYNQAGNYSIKLVAWNNNVKGTKDFTFSVDSAVSLNFNPEILVNDFAPAEISLHNLTTGASSYSWTFEEGVPGVSTEKQPENIKFDAAGEHKISLTVSNGRSTFSTTKSINLQPKINVDFDITPSFNDFDYEVPFTANLVNKTTSGLIYQWAATGGSISDKTAYNSILYLTTPGTYTVTLSGNNEKETKTALKEITVKQNTNLYTLTNIKFGIKKAESSIGCFYSISQRQLLTKSEITTSNGKSIDLVFFALDAGFSRCYFLSPDNVYSSGFSIIPAASVTYIANDVTSLGFTDADFVSMADDSKLKSLNIRGAANSTAFTNVYVPRLVLFETQGGIKGAIRIKAFVSEGDNSYVLADIKVQKE